MNLSKNGHIVYTVYDRDVLSGVLTLPESVKFVNYNINFLLNGTKIKKLVLPNVEIISSKTFAGLPIEEIVAPKLTQISKEAFKDCTELEYVKTPQVEMIGERAFEGCKKLKYVELVHVKEIGDDAFEYTDSLQVLGNLGYTKIGFNSRQSNHMIIVLARKIRIRKGEIEDKKNNRVVNYRKTNILHREPQNQSNENAQGNQIITK